MSFGAALEGFVSGFKTGADIKERKRESDRRDRREPYELAHMEAQTERLKLGNKWFDTLTELDVRNTESSIAARDKETSWADRKNRSAIDYQDASTFRLINPIQKTGRDGASDDEILEGLPGAVGSGGSDELSGSSGQDTLGGALPIQQTNAGGAFNYDTAEALYNTAKDLGVSPYDLAAVIDYETIGKWNPDIRGGKGNNYIGLIQFGPQERQAYGYRPGMSVAEQIEGPVKAYLADRGVRPGHGVDEIYSIINAGSLDNSGRPRYHLSDGNGTVADHIERIKQRNRPRAQQLFGEYIVPVQSAASGGLIQPAGALPVGGTMNPLNNRPNLENEDGSYSTEMSITVTNPRLNGGKPTNIPSIWNGRRLDPNNEELIVDAAIRSGQQFPAYNTVDEAVSAAKQRSASLDAGTPSGGGALPIEDKSTEESPASRADPKKHGFKVANEAVKEGMQYALQQFGLGDPSAVQDPQRAAKMAAYLKGQGAAEPSLMKKVYDAIDPKGELSESERSMAALAHVYNFYAKRGEPEKAQEAAGSIVQFQRVLFQRYTAIAQAAIEEGDLDGGVEAAVRAYASVPDGMDVKVKKQGDKYVIEQIDEATGKVVSKPVMDPREMAAMALKVSPVNFDQFILGAAGLREKETGVSPQLESALEIVERGGTVKQSDIEGMNLEERRYLDGIIKGKADARKKHLDSVTSGGNSRRGSGGGGQPSNADYRSAREDISNVWETLAADESGAYEALTTIPEPVKRTMQNAAAGIMAETPDVAPEDALDIAVEIAHFDGTLDQKSRSFSAIQEGDYYRVTLLNGKEVLMPASRYEELDNIWKRYAKQHFDAREVEAAAERRKAQARRETTQQREQAVRNADPNSAVPVERSDPFAIPQSQMERERRYLQGEGTNEEDLDGVGYSLDYLRRLMGP